jgi:hypothetical protein
VRFRAKVLAAPAFNQLRIGVVIAVVIRHNRKHRNQLHQPTRNPLRFNAEILSRLRSRRVADTGCK